MLTPFPGEPQIYFWNEKKGKLEMRGGEKESIASKWMGRERERERKKARKIAEHEWPDPGDLARE